MQNIPQAGTKVIVQSFEATVVHWNENFCCVKVQDDSGQYHYLFHNQLAQVIPYTDGKKYIDADDETFIFRAKGNGIIVGPNWESTHRNPSIRHVYTYARRPLREVGPVIEE